MSPYTKPTPSNTTWAIAYANNKDCSLIFNHLIANAAWTETILCTLPDSYHSPLHDKHINWEPQHLMYTKPIKGSQNGLILIIVPSKHRRTIFDIYHGTPVDGHLDRYKTLYRLHLRFFWPRLCYYVEEVIKECPHCALTNSHLQTASELMYSWPLGSPFAILHVDLWKPGDTIDSDDHISLMHCMGNMTQFVNMVPTTDIHAHTLAKILMREVPLKIGFCAMIVVDDGSIFKELFVKVCAHLHPIAKSNAQALSFECYHCYLNKAISIATNDCATNKDFVLAAAAAACYVWNSSTIDGTYITPCIPAVGHEFKFPFDFILHPTPKLTQNHAATIHNSLKHTAFNVPFSREILKILLEECHTIHRERTNLGCNQPFFELGNIVTACVLVHSDTSKHRVAKFLYEAKGPYVITQVTNYGSYYVQN
jgi:hypothetical protein